MNISPNFNLPVSDSKEKKSEESVESVESVESSLLPEVGSLLAATEVGSLLAAGNCVC